jgi:CelD/BcsL family acetyltransferase involved in cellulose biosynthesis
MTATDVVVLAPSLVPPPTAEAPAPALDAVRVALETAAAAPAPAPATLAVETVSDFDALLELGPAWNALVEKSGLDHPFLTHDWVRAWWEHFGTGRQLHVLVVKAGLEAVAIAPLMLCRVRIGGLSVRRLQLIANVQTPRADFIVGPRKEEAYEALWDCLVAQRALWDALVLPQVPTDSATLEALPRLAARDGFRAGTWCRPSDRSPRLPLGASWDAILAGLARKFRSNLRNRTKRLEQMGRVEVKSVEGGPGIGVALEEGFALEAAAWKGSGGTAIQCRPELRLFYSGMAAAAAARGWLRLDFLCVEGRPIAFAYMLSFKKTLFLLKPGYDPAYAACSPSNILLSMVLRDAVARGIREFDFLGEDDPWKLGWTSELRPHSWLFVFQKTRRGRLLHFLKFRLLPRFKAARRTLVATFARLLPAGWSCASAIES